MGKVYIVGAGPGDVELVTIKALRAIREADVILYDRLVNPDLLKEAKVNATLIFCGKTPKCHVMKQEEIQRQLVYYAKQGKIVTRLKGGDPFIFGRGAEEAQYIRRHHIPFEIIPGISSGIAAPMYAGIPVTHRELGTNFAIVTGHRKKDGEDTTDWSSLGKAVDTLLIYMGVSSLPQICHKLIKGGKEQTTPVALIEWGTTDQQRVVVGNLENITMKAKQQQVKNPSMIVVGEVVNLHQELDWFIPAAMMSEVL